LPLYFAIERIWGIKRKTKETIYEP